LDGHLDELNQAFVTFDYGQGPLDFHIDTGFSGTLLIGEEVFDRTQATPAGTIEAELAAYQVWTFERYDLQFTWFGRDTLARVLIGPGKQCLIGTELLNPHRLEIDFGKRTVQLQCNPDW